MHSSFGRNNIHDVLSHALNVHFASRGDKIVPSDVVLALADFTRHILDVIKECDETCASELQIKVADAILCLGRPSAVKKIPSVRDFENEFVALNALRAKPQERAPVAVYAAPQVQPLRAGWLSDGRGHLRKLIAGVGKRRADIQGEKGLSAGIPSTPSA